MKLVDILNLKFPRSAILRFLNYGEKCTFEGSGYLGCDEFSLRPYADRTDIVAHGSNDSHYVGTVHGIGISHLRRIFRFANRAF